MGVYLSQLQSAFPTVYEAKKTLNAEFMAKGRIIDAVSVIYHPYQHGPMAHGSLEVEGVCYSFKNFLGPWKTIPKAQSYHRKIYKARRGDGVLPFVRFGIAVTPLQLKGIREDMQSFKSMIGLTCMHGVKRALSKYADYHVFFPISVYPTVTAGTLYASKILGSKKITQIDPHLSRRTKGSFAMDIISAGVLEMMVIAMLVSHVYIALFL